VSEYLATERLEGEAPTVEGRLADIFALEDAVLSVDEYKLSASDKAKVVAALRLAASSPAMVEQAVEAERKRCTALCEGWIGRFQDRDIQYTSAREYAVGAIEDIIDLIRDGTPAAVGQGLKP